MPHGGRDGRGAPRGRAFWSVAYALAVISMGTTLPSPLYAVYQGDWHFSAGTLTVVFAAFIAGVIVALVFLAGLSDALGRRRVLLQALALAAISALVFALAPRVMWLLVARALVGLATGVATGAAVAALDELHPDGDRRRASLVSTVSNVSGFAVGPLLAGLLVQYGPRPTLLVWVVYLALLVPAFLGVWAIPETALLASGLSVRPHIGVAPGLRVPFALAATVVFCAFAGSGLYTALASSVVTGLLHMCNRAIGGAIVFALLGTSAVAQVALRRLPDRQAMGGGLVILVGGLTVLTVAVRDESFVVFLVSAVCVGLGHGLAFRGSLAFVTRLPPPTGREGMVAGYFVVAYLGLGVPVLGVGLASERIGFGAAADAFTGVLGALALGAAMAIARSTRRRGGDAIPQSRF